MAVSADGATPAEDSETAPASQPDSAPESTSAKASFKVETPDPKAVSKVTTANEEAVLHGIDPHLKKAGFFGMALGSVGVVFGDIGTSPLYAFNAAIGQAAHDPVTRPAVLGVVSLAIWALLVVVTFKYVLFVMRADNKGEGGILSLMAWRSGRSARRTTLVFIMGLVGAALVLWRRGHHPRHFGARRLPGNAGHPGNPPSGEAGIHHRRRLRHADRPVHGAGQRAPRASPRCSGR